METGVTLDLGPLQAQGGVVDITTPLSLCSYLSGDRLATLCEILRGPEACTHAHKGSQGTFAKVPVTLLLRQPSPSQSWGKSPGEERERATWPSLRAAQRYVNNSYI